MIWPVSGWARAILAWSRALGWLQKSWVIGPELFGGSRSTISFRAFGSWPAKHFFLEQICREKILQKFCTKVRLLNWLTSMLVKIFRSWIRFPQSLSKLVNLSLAFVLFLFLSYNIFKDNYDRRWTFQLNLKRFLLILLLVGVQMLTLVFCRCIFTI